MIAHDKELLRLATHLDEARDEIRLARRQSVKPGHLNMRTRRVAVKAARAVIRATELGCDEVWETSSFIVPLLRRAANPESELSDEVAFRLWTTFICPELRNSNRTAEAAAGNFDFPKVKTDEKGRAVGKDGKPLQRVAKTDPTGKVIGWKLDGDLTYVTDDYDDADMLEHLRCRSADWADACNVAADIIRAQDLGQNEASVRLPEETGKPAETRARVSWHAARDAMLRMRDGEESQEGNGVQSAASPTTALSRRMEERSGVVEFQLARSDRMTVGSFCTFSAEIRRIERGLHQRSRVLRRTFRSTPIEASRTPTRRLSALDSRLTSVSQEGLWNVWASAMSRQDGLRTTSRFQNEMDLETW